MAQSYFRWDHWQYYVTTTILCLVLVTRLRVAITWECFSKTK